VFTENSPCFSASQISFRRLIGNENYELRTITMRIKQYFNTMFPRFHDHETEVDSDSVPDSLDSSVSESSEGELITKHEKYRTKEDEDIAVFMRLEQKMSMKSLLFIMQDHARAMNIPEDVLQKHIACDALSLTAKKATLKIKKFRFAEISGGDKVRAVVHEIPKATDPSLWWNKDELKDIRSDVIQAVKYFKRYRPEFSESVQILATSYLDEIPNYVLKEHMKQLSGGSIARGLETHIVPLLGALRRSSVRAVLAEQEMCRKSCKSYDETCEILRSRSLSESKPGQTFAAKIGECDHIEALKASLSRWAMQERQKFFENPPSESLCNP
jgi:hypothetical protein